MSPIQSVAQLSHYLEEAPFGYAAQQISASFSTGRSERWYEWLLRPQIEGVSPADFVSAVQSMELAVDLDQRVVRDAIAWLDRQPINTRLSINLTSDSLSNRFFARYVKGLLNASTVIPEQICFDLLVGDAVRDLGGTSRFVHQMRELGCAIAIDGGSPANPVLGLLGPMGYIDYYKINRDLVSQATVSTAHRSTLESVCEYSKRLSLELIAIGVDSDAHLELIRELGVDFFQGFVNGEPVTVNYYASGQQMRSVSA